MNPLFVHLVKRYEQRLLQPKAGVENVGTSNSTSRTANIFSTSTAPQRVSSQNKDLMYTSSGPDQTAELSLPKLKRDIFKSTLPQELFKQKVQMAVVKSALGRFPQNFAKVQKLPDSN